MSKLWPEMLKPDEYKVYDPSISERVSFNEVVRPAIRWINDNANPHDIIVIDGTSAVLYSGEKSVLTDEFIKD